MHHFVLKSYPLLKFAWHYRYPLLAIAVLGALFLRAFIDLFTADGLSHLHSSGLMFISAVGVFALTMTVRVQYKRDLEGATKRPSTSTSN
ncbi:MAG: hypothetical protein CBC55_00795 [Gammaproteobacteria bacterium TMED95]|nr:MAG: hypothetical protein CBC55_00795 [Gammaproteobacteria bacterium TMED95]|tara:strand:- start:23544 stop:23813 length:270 start_codon:yes stop_codon:yes gene_type:complete